MAIILVPIRNLFQEELHIVNERILPFVEEHARSCMQGLQVHQAVANAALTNDFVDALGDVEQLHAVAGDPIQDTIKDLITARGAGLRGLRFGFQYLDF